MKLSMWILKDWFEKHHIQHRIKEGQATISGVRFLSSELQKYPRSYVYISQASTIFDDSTYENKSILVNGHDYIILDEPDIEIVLNEVLAAFEYYNQWEANLIAAAQKDNPIQRMLDLSDAILQKPSRVMNHYGNIIAISKSYDPDEIGEKWKQMCQTRMVQLKNVGTPVITADGKVLPEWTCTPQVYITEGNLRPYIAANIVVDSENVAAFLMQQHKADFTPANCQLAAVFCDAVRLVANNTEQQQLMSTAALLHQLIEGKNVDENLTDKLTCISGSAPWYLVNMNSMRSNTPMIRKGSMLNLLWNSEISNVSTSYGDNIVSVVSESSLPQYLGVIERVVNMNYYTIGISLPFWKWSEVQTRYQQAVFAASKGSRGIYYCKDYAYEFLLSSIRESNKELNLIHPAIETLTIYDRKNETEFLKTLYVYLRNERNLANTCRLLFTHRNTLIYRIKRIEALVNVDLNDPIERDYLMLSFHLAKPFT